MLDPALALLISIAAILILIRLKVPAGFGVLAGCVILIFTVISFKDIPSLLLTTIKDKQTWQLLIIVPCTMTLSSLMEQKGMLLRLAAVLEGIGPRVAIYVLPAVIGLVPMPAGALVAATAVKGLAERLHLAPERITFINYWFRHIWEYSLPIYPGLLIVGTILGIPISTVVKTLFPMSLIAVLLGLILSLRWMKKAPDAEKKPRDTFKNIIFSFFKTAWPIMLLIILIFATVPPWLAFPVVLLLTAIQQRVSRPQVKKALKYGVNPLILLLLLAVMLYQWTVKDSNAAGLLVEKMQEMGLPSLMMLVGIPLLIGTTIGYGPAISGISLPLLAPYIVTSDGLQWTALLVAYASGMIGQLLSPAHLCFALSVEYFKTTLGKVYRYTVPLLLIMEIIVIAIFLIF